MPNGTRWVGLDVHARADGVRDLRQRDGRGDHARMLPGARTRSCRGCWSCERPVRAVYEAGPTGYGLARRARAAGIDMQVCAPGMIPKGAGDRVKTDKRDAIKLARLHAAGQLVFVHVPVRRA